MFVQGEQVKIKGEPEFKVCFYDRFCSKTNQHILVNHLGSECYIIDKRVILKASLVSKAVSFVLRRKL